jgi:hypothetical protein
LPVKHLRDGDGREVSSAAVEQLREASGSRKSHDAAPSVHVATPVNYVEFAPSNKADWMSIDDFLARVPRDELHKQALERPMERIARAFSSS